VQTKSLYQLAGGTTVSLNVSSTNQGDLLVIGIQSNGAVQKPTDNLHDTYVLAASSSFTGGTVTNVYYLANAPAGITTVSTTFAFGSAAIVASEYSGVVPVSPFDASSTHDNGYKTGASWTSGSATAHNPGELLWGFAGDSYGNATSWAPASGWTAEATFGTSLVEDNVASAAGSYAATGTIGIPGGSDYDIGTVLLTFKGNGATTPGVQLTSQAATPSRMDIAVTSPRGVAYESSTNSVWTLNLVGQMVKYNPQTGASTTEPGLPSGAGYRELMYETSTNSLWTLGSASNTLVQINPVTGTSTSISNLGLNSPWAITYDSFHNALWITNNGGTNATTYNLSSGATSSVSVGGAPWGLAFDPNTNNMWIANNGSSSVTRYNVQTGASTTFVTFANPRGVAYDSINHFIWVGGSGTSLWKFDPNTGATTSVSLGMSYGGDHLMFDPITDSIWVAYTNGSTGGLIKVNPVSGTSTVFFTGSSPQQLTLDPISNSIWVVNTNSATISKVSLTPALATTYPGNSNIEGLAFDPSSNAIWYASGTTMMAKLNLATGAVIATTSMTGAADGIAFDASNTAIWVAENDKILTRINPNTALIVSTTSFPNGASIPYPIAVDPSSNSVFAGDTNGVIYKFNAANGAFISSTTLGNPTLVAGNNFVFDTYNNVIWAPSRWSNALYRLNSSGAIVATTSLPGTAVPYGATFDPSTNSVWVESSNSSTITKVNVQTGASSTYSVAFTSSNPEGIAYDALSGAVYVIGGLQLIPKVSPSTGQVVGYFYENNTEANNNVYLAITESSTNSLWATDITAQTLVRVPLSSYSTSGTFTSAAINLPNSSWGNLSWTSNGLQTITLKARSANNSSMTGATAWTSCGTISSGGSLASGGCVNNGDPYIQYQATLSTNSLVQTPILQSVSIGYVTVVASGSLTSSMYNTSSTANTMGALSWYEGTLPASTTLTVSLRTGSTTAAVASSSWTNFTDATAGCTLSAGVVTCPSTVMPASMETSTGNQWFQYKVSLTSNGNGVPSISSTSINYVVNAPPQFSTSTPLTASEVTTSSTNAGRIQIQYSVGDPDEDTDNASGGHATSTLTPTIYYSLDGGTTWATSTAFVNSIGDITLTGTTTYVTTTTIWNAAIDSAGTYNASALIKVTVDDHQGANNLASATSSAFMLDTKAPVVNAVTMDAGAQTISFNFSDDSNLLYRISGSSFTTSTPTSTLAFTVVGGTSTSTSGFPVTFSSTSSPMLYLELRDVYGNDTYQTVSGPAVPTGFIVKDISNKSLNNYQTYLSWATSSISNFKQYDIFRSTGGAFSQLATISQSSTNSYVDTGLSSTTVYYYKLRVEDTAGNISAFTQQVFITPTGNNGGPAISSVAANPSDTSAIVTWNTNILPSSSYVYWSQSPVLALPISIVAAVATSGPPYVNTGMLNNLTPSTTYYFYVQSTDAQGNTTIDNNNGAYYSFQATNGNPPVISNIQVTPTQNSADIRWSTDKAANSAVFYGTTSHNETSSVSSTVSLTTTPEVVLTNLLASTTYYYYLQSVDSLGHAATTSESFFTTSQLGPVISGVTSTNITTTGATIAWTTSKTANSNVYYSTSTNASTFTGVQVSDASTTHAIGITGLAPSTTYYYYVQANDGFGNVTTDNNGSAYYSFHTLSDTTPPVISNITVPTLGQTVATVAWNTDELSTSQVIYGTSSGSYPSSTAVATTTVTSHSVSLSGLVSAKTYYFKVISADPYGNTSTSTQQTFTTLTLPGPQISSTTVASTSDFGATITWNTDTNSDSHVYYSTATSSFTNSAGTNALVGGSSTPYAHSITLANLTPSTTYYFYVQSVDASNNATIDNQGGAYYSFITSNSSTPVISSIQASSITSSTAAITWSTNKLANSQVLYGTAPGSYPSSTAISDTSPMVSAHAVTLSGLAPNTQYYYVVRSIDSASNTAQSSENSFTTIEPLGPRISSTTIASTSDFGAAVTWYTDTNADSHVFYGNATTSLSLSAGTSNLVGGTSTPYFHTVTITNLAPSTTYYFYVQSVDAYGNSTIDKNGGAYYSFFTTNNTTPVISNLSVVVKDQNTAGFTWSTNKPANSEILYGTSTGMYSASSSITDTSFVTSPHSVSLGGLTPNTKYYFIAQSVDAANNVGTSSEQSFTTTQSPGPVISNVSSTPFDTTALITWNTDINADSFVFYGTSTGSMASSTGSATLVGGSSTPYVHSVTITSLATGTQYYYYVQSTDASGNIATDKSNPITFTTNAGLFSNVTTTYLGDTEAIIGWQTTMDSNSFVHYFQPNVGGTNIIGVGTTTLVGGSAPFTHSVSASGLTQGTTYDFYLESDDAADNVHVDNNAGRYYNFTTTDHRPPVISGITVPIVNDSSAIVVWSTDRLSTSQVDYGLVSGIYTTSTVQDPTLTTYHAVTIANLQASTTYYFRVRSDSAAGAETASGDNSFGTLAPNTTQTIIVGSPFPAPDTTPPKISQLTATTTPFDATVNFVTNEPSIGIIQYGSSTDYSYAAADGAFSTLHSIKAKGLIMGTTYHFNAKAIDQSGNVATTTDGTFATQFLTEANLPASTTFENAYQFQQEIENSIASALPSLVPPFLSAPTVTKVGENGATVSWTTNIKSYSVVFYATEADYNAGSSSSSYASQVSDVNNKTITHSLDLTGLVPNTTYHVMAESFSIPGVFGKSADVTFTTAATKVTPQISNITPTSFQVSWSTDSLTNSIVQYKDTKTGLSQTITDEAMVKLHSVTVSNLTPATNYSVSVSGLTAAGNTVAAATPIAVRTTVDTTPPVISNIRIQTIIDPQTPTVAQAIVGWVTDKPSNSVVKYDQGVGDSSSTFSHTVQDLTSFVTSHVAIVPNLVPGSVYRLQIISTDQASNTTAYPPQTIIVSQQSQSILDVILNNFENTFQFVHNIQK